MATSKYKLTSVICGTQVSNYSGNHIRNTLLISYICLIRHMFGECHHSFNGGVWCRGGNKIAICIDGRHKIVTHYAT